MVRLLLTMMIGSVSVHGTSYCMSAVRGPPLSLGSWSPGSSLSFSPKEEGVGGREAGATPTAPSFQTGALGPTSSVPSVPVGARAPSSGPPSPGSQHQLPNDTPHASFDISYYFGRGNGMIGSPSEIFNHLCDFNQFRTRPLVSPNGGGVSVRSFPMFRTARMLMDHANLMSVRLCDAHVLRARCHDLSAPDARAALRCGLGTRRL